MREIDLYTYLKSLMPDGMQFVLSYLDSVPLPKRGTDWAQMTVLNVTPKAWAQERQTAYNSETASVSVSYDWNKIYNVQFDFYGENAFDNANIFYQNLQINLVNDKNAPVHLGRLGEIRNLTFLEDMKRFCRRYTFVVEFLAVDTITQEHWTITSAPVSCLTVGRGSK